MTRYFSEFSITALERVVSLGKCAALRVENFHRTQPVLVYQMGKVGSLAVHEALGEAFPHRSFFHLHFLTPEGWKRAADYYRAQKAPRLPEHMYISRELMRKMSRLTDYRWPVVTLFRDPVARDLSGYFQHLRHRHPQIRENNAESVAICLRELRRRFASFDPDDDYTANWMTREPGRAFDIDVYAQAFDYERGFSRVVGASADLLIIDSSRLTEVFAAAAGEFFDVGRTVAISRRNVTGEQPHGPLYREVVNRFRIPREWCERIYATPFARHFLSREKIDSLIGRWAED